MNDISYFHQERKWRTDSLNEVKKFIPTNDYLKKFDWLFIPPLYMQGFEIRLLKELMLAGNTDPDKITNIFKNKFYDLSWSASFIRGHCNRVKYIAPFTNSIEHSMLLAYQYDFEGAIKTILPIIEGILRQYLSHHKGFTGRVTYNILTNSLESIKEEILIRKKNCIVNYKNHNNQFVNFSAEQIQELLDLDKQYYDIWFSFFSDFINQSLYKRSNGNDTNGELNRHNILHVFNALPFNYSLQNYLKLYTSINFLLWAFLSLEGKSMFSQSSNEDFAKTYVAYRRIIINSKFLLETKADLDDRYKPFVKYTTSFKEIIINFLLYKLAKDKKK